jgi:hypothetical protein
MKILNINAYKVQVKKLESVVNCFQSSLYVDKVIVHHYGNTDTEALTKVLVYMAETNILYKKEYLDFTLGGNPDLKDF